MAKQYALFLISFMLLFEVSATKSSRTYSAGATEIPATAGQPANSPYTIQSNAYLVVENLDRFPAPDHLTFSLVQKPWNREGTPLNRNHNKVQLKVSNKGEELLTVSKLRFSDAAAWKISSVGNEEYTPATALPLSIKAGASVVLTVEFIAKNQGDRVKVLHGSLFISSNDAVTPEKEVKLHGLWQRSGEGNNEPYAQEIINAFGFKTNTGYGANDGSNDGSTIIKDSDEILSAFFVRADASRPVEVIQMAAYHGCCSQKESFSWYEKGSSNTNTLFTHHNLDGQSLLPLASGSSAALAQGTFNASKPFGFKVSSAYSDKSKNHKGKIGMRIWKAIDANGNIMPNAYIIGSDYLGTEFTNYDYQDNVYFVRNVRPENGTAHYAELSASPSALTFDPAQTGSRIKLSVSVKNMGKAHTDGSSDPSAQIKKVEIAGPNRNEFTASMPAVTQLAAQASAEIPVEFKPNSQGLKNATLLVHHTNGASPLRIPLYGIANKGSDAITAAKRIKSASDVKVTIGGNVWEADKSYRKGSIKMDKQVIASPIAATEDDVLYQTYLSAAKDLAETLYEIPVEDGNYTLRMHFVENYWSAAVARLFHVIIEDQLRLPNLDIYQEVGYRAALVKDFEVSVTGGVLNIKFVPTVNRVAIAGLELFKGTGNVTSVTPEEEQEKRRVLVYPNPGEGEEVQVVVQHFDRQEEMEVSLHDIVGRKVYSQTVVSDSQGNATIPIATTTFQKGMYVVQVNAPSGKAQLKLLLK